MNIKITDFIFLSVLILLVIFYFSFNPLNHDATWLLFCADKILDGNTLYIDLVEVNPPLIVIYSMLPALITKLIPITLAQSYVIFVLLLIFMSLILSYSILKKYYSEKGNELRYYLYSIAFILTISVSYNFGQREHLFMIFILPYILMMIYKDKINLSLSNIVLISVFASLGFNIKPHFFIVFIGIELFYMISSKRISSIFRVDSLIIICSAFLYLLLIYIKFPEYINVAIPLAMDTYSIAANKTYAYLLLEHQILFLFLTFIFWFYFTNKKMDYPVKIFFCLLLSSLAIYFLQKKGWSYHSLPLFVITQLFVTHITLNILKKDSKLFAFSFVPVIIFILINNIPPPNRYEELKNIVQMQPRNSTIQIFSVYLSKGQPLLVEKEQKWGLRFPSLFVLYSAVNEHNKSAEKYLFNAIYEDTARYKPDTIIFCKPTSFDYYKYFSQHKQLKEIYDSYYKKSVIDGYITLSKHKKINLSDEL